ncbi:UNVERIFIED_CONTAM: hypothetical protein NCL1_45238 [Trichonephila clavipes]
MEPAAQTECQPTFVDNKICCDDSAFSPSIIEIGFIDEDEAISDLSEFSVSEEDKDKNWASFQPDDLKL